MHIYSHTISFSYFLYINTINIDLSISAVNLFWTTSHRLGCPIPCSTPPWFTHCIICIADRIPRHPIQPPPLPPPPPPLSIQRQFSVHNFWWKRPQSDFIHCARKWLVTVKQQNHLRYIQHFVTQGYHVLLLYNTCCTNIILSAFLCWEYILVLVRSVDFILQNIFLKVIHVLK